MKITKTWARKAFKAVNETIAKYKTNSDDSCSFCDVAREYFTRKGYDCCEACPWEVFYGFGCDGPTGRVKDKWYYETFPISNRLRRLYGWRKRLTNIIERS